MRGDVLALTSDLQDITRLAGDPDQVVSLLDRALASLADVIPYEMAAVLSLTDDELTVKHARGPLVTPKVLQHKLRLADMPSLRRVIESGRACIKSEDDHDQDHGSGDGDPYDSVLDLPAGHSCMVVPVYVGERPYGVITFDSRTCDLYGESTIELVTVYSRIIGLGLSAAAQAAELERLRRRLEEHNRLLRAEVNAQTDATVVLERCPSSPMRKLVEMAKQVAASDAPVLITGETGTGKEILARAIHDWSPRGNGAAERTDTPRRGPPEGHPFVSINCAALPETLIESELFGHKKGAFSGATSDRPGRFAIADGGTLLLDEVGDLPLPLQVKLLRVLQEGAFEPVGSDRTVKVNVRIVAATNVDLEQAIEAGRFREDLYYRLQVFPLHVPPVRERLEDLSALVYSILEAAQRREGRGPWTVSAASLARMREYDWPGNVRELVNTLERARVLTPVGELEVQIMPRRRSAGGQPPTDRSTTDSAALAAIRVDDAGGMPTAQAGKFATLREHERAYVARVLTATKGRIYGKDGAAEILGLAPSTLQTRMAKLGLDRADFA